MKEIARTHQLIVITHLPQIAAQGISHYSVQKIEANGRTRVEIRKLTEDERISDIAKLMSGKNITSTTLASARELLAQSYDG